MAKGPASNSPANQTLRYQLSQAALQGYLDGAISSHIGAAKAAGYIPNQETDTSPEGGPIGGINR